MKSSSVEINEMRKEQGYEPIELVGWAKKPYYDQENRKLHWAKELQLGNEDINTLNYNIRILGREGVLMLNAISYMDKLKEVDTDIEPLLQNINFNQGNRYSEFDPDVDKIAAYGIGGLIAGKVLTKAGFWVAIAKFWKVILAAIVGGFALFRKFIFGKKEDKETTSEADSENPEA